jgi:glycosyltransferase involved in cell wall biosynthesis
VPVLLAAADVLVHSSVLPEPFGLVIMEAMAMERPVVTSRLGGPGEIVRDGYEGVLVDPSNPEEIAAALLRLAADPALRTRLGRAGRVRALGCFGAERFVREMAAVLHEVAWSQATGGRRQATDAVLHEAAWGCEVRPR